MATSLAIALLASGPPALVPGRDGGVGFAPGPAVVAAASPGPSAPGGDTRSAGEGPGLVGAPFLAILGVVLLGLLAAGATLVYLRLTSEPGGAEKRRERRPGGRRG